MNFYLDHLYTFRYKAVGEGVLHVYDKTPLIFILDASPDRILGVNLHWIPKSHRLKFFNEVREIMDKTHTVGKKKERMRLTYQLLQKPQFRIGLQAIRFYYIHGMSAIKDLPEVRWNVIIGMSQYRMRKVYKSKEYKD